MLPPMASSSLTIEPLAGALGAEVSGVDLTRPLDDATVEAIHAAWMTHQVLFFRDQPVTLDQHKAFARRFGELHVHPVLQQLKDQGHPEIVVLESHGAAPYVASEWHSDVTFERRPPLGSVLHAVEVPAAGGDTMWASMYAAYDALSGEMQRLLSSLRAIHDGGGFRVIASTEQQAALEQDERAVHPVVRTHPVTGRKALFVNATFTKAIEGMHLTESRALLRFLFEHVASPEFSCRFRWRPHSIAMWDNRCTQHRVIADAVTLPRRMQRVTICGDEPR
jgi:taurine dioxygenase